MLDSDAIARAIPLSFDRFEVPGDLPRGKVRDFYVMADGTHRVLISTDRMTVFDRQVGLIPYKGQVLNQLSAWWFQRTQDILANHYVSSPDPNVMIVRESRPILLEVVVRGYITGTTKTSLWTRYAAGEREIYGYHFPEGLRKNQPLPQPLITPSTKSLIGHDERTPISHVVENKFLTAAVWDQVRAAALGLFKRASETAAKGGLIMVDSKYEFGYDEETGKLLVIDELHTPDSSRFWLAKTYEERLKADAEPDNYDRELVRLWYVQQANAASGKSPRMNTDLIVTVSQRYQQVYEAITEQPFEPAAYPAQPRIEAAIAEYA